MTPEEWARKAEDNWMNEPINGDLDMNHHIADAIRSAIAEALSAGLPPVTLSPADLAAIREREAKATPGPWHEGIGEIYTDTPTPAMRWLSQPTRAGVGYDRDRRVADEAFIAHSRQDIPALLAYIEHLEGLFRDLANDGQLEAYKRGYADGQKIDTEKVIAWLAAMPQEQRALHTDAVSEAYCDHCGSDDGLSCHCDNDE